MQHKSFITLPYKIEHPCPWAEENEMKYPESLVRYFLKNYTKRGDKIFDPFMGLGTTAFVAEEMGRIPYGTEFDRRRFEYAAGQLHHWGNIVHGDAGKLSTHTFQKWILRLRHRPICQSIINGILSLLETRPRQDMICT